jgi:hypothetical protein
MDMRKRFEFQAGPEEQNIKESVLGPRILTAVGLRVCSTSVGFIWCAKQLFCLFKLCMSYNGSIKYHAIQPAILN